MLCKFCADWDLDLFNRYSPIPYHETWAALVASADGGCKLCCVLVSSVRKQESYIAAGYFKGLYSFINKETGRFPGSTLVFCFPGGGFNSLKWYMANSAREALDFHRRINHLGAVQFGELRILSNTGVFLFPNYKKQYHTPFEELLGDGTSLMMRRWLDNCSNSHPSCPAQVEHQLPSRVIDIRLGDVQPPRLVISAGRKGKYTALSHCWGSFMPLKTECANLEAHCAALPLDKLPATFKEAMEVTRMLGVRYIWIDSLCIIQDSESDWQQESSVMHQVYKHAQVTIAAEAAEDCSRGLIGSSIGGRVALMDKIITVRYHSLKRKLSGEMHLCLLADIRELNRGPLGRRAWVLQEEILSPRIIQFTESLVRWRCHCLHADEVYPRGFLVSRSSDNNYIEELAHPYVHIPGNDAEFYLEESDSSQSSSSGGDSNYAPGEVGVKFDEYRYWYLNVVDAFAIRKLSFPRDKLKAVAGIAREIALHVAEKERQQRTYEDHTTGKEARESEKDDDSVNMKATSCVPQEKYRAGLWIDDLHRGLLWSYRTDDPDSYWVPYSLYVAPSWSWASVEIFTTLSGNQNDLYLDLLETCSDYLYEFAPLAEIIDVSIVNVNEDPFGQVMEGKPTIRSEIQDICSCHVPLAFLDRHMPHEDGRTMPATGIPSGLSAEKYDNSLKSHKTSGVRIEMILRKEFKELRSKYTGTRGCLSDPDLFHHALSYVKIAKLQRYQNRAREQDVLVACLILEPCSTEKGTQYKRVGRAIVLPNHSIRSQEEHSWTKEKLWDKWPIQTVEII